MTRAVSIEKLDCRELSGRSNRALDGRHDNLAAASIIIKAAVFAGLVLLVLCFILVLLTEADWARSNRPSRCGAQQKWVRKGHHTSDSRMQEILWSCFSNE